jgi:ABC-type uncharacterized transport system auxiliary subunit
MRRHLTLALAATVVTTIAACGSDSNAALTLAPTEANVVGTYNLSLAAGQTLPYFAYDSATASVNVAADKIVLLANNSWVDTTTYAVVDLTTGSISTQQSATAGAYEVKSGQINFVKTIGGSGAFIGSVTSNVLTVIFVSQRYIYTR